ncbi:hypothetical protein [Streptomyces sp. NBC_01244]|uniref:hypothetical protein n=1 Tax=Streptomyces sp. NBC_01244 TaxID=2903797 RepID=UPI002E0F6667|nr:hypothetical protein OG247_42180 [Streptomyces sp. NBC_01244]
MRIRTVIRPAVAVAMAGVLLAGCGASRQEVLDMFGLQLPACETENLRYSVAELDDVPGDGGDGLLTAGTAVESGAVVCEVRAEL